MKITLDTVASGYDLSKINSNFVKIQNELNEKVLYRNPPTGEANTLEQNLDANGKTIYNLGGIALSGDVTLQELTAQAEAARDVAVAAKDVVVALGDAFGDIYLGAKASDPALDNDGNSLQKGALYLKTGVSPIMRVYNEAAWQDVGTISSTTTTSIDGALYASQVEAEQGTNNTKVVTPLRVKQSIAAEVGTSVQAYDATTLKAAAIGVSVQPYDADTPTVAASQAEMEAGTEAALRSMSPLLVKQAISANPSSSRIVKFSSGTGSWTVPAGVTTLLVSGSAGGGGGSGSGGGSGESNTAGIAGSNSTLSSGASLTLTGGAGGAATTTASSQTANGGVGVYDGEGGIAGASASYIGKNGAAGQKAVRRKISVTPGATINYTVGAGGQGGSAYSGNGAGGAAGTNTDTASSVGSAYAGAYYGGSGGSPGYWIFEW